MMGAAAERYFGNGSGATVNGLLMTFAKFMGEFITKLLQSLWVLWARQTFGLLEGAGSF